MNKVQFEDLKLSDRLLEVIKKKGFEEPTEIQAKAIPLMLSGTKDIIGQAQTGTGKTAAFGLPILELLSEDQKGVQVLILVPTRELALQVAEELNSLKCDKKLQILPVYGGQSIQDQIRRIKKGSNIIVGTPGRVIDHLKRKTLNFDNIQFMVLDEADEMLNMGFLDEVEAILEQTNKEKRVLLFSATMPKHIKKIAEKYMKEYDLITTDVDSLTIDNTEQIYFEVNNAYKFEA
jgi:ATP-dependent RNA helicase DeaD